MDRKIIFLLLFTSIQFMAFSQKVIVKGTLTEELNGAQVPLPFANVYFEGTTNGTTTDFDGNFSLTTNPGSHVLLCTFMGYETFKKPLEIISEGIVSLNIQMKPEGIAIEGVEVVAKMNRESEVALTMEQKNSVLVLQNIGAAELSRKGAGNAEEALTKVSGVTKQEGVKNIFVRGLGDRYNSTTLNGLPLPSDDPENKNISLDMFSADIINSIGINKALNSTISGDVGGANINIGSKELYDSALYEIGMSAGVNTQTQGRTLKTVDGASRLGFVENKSNSVTNLETYQFPNSYKWGTKNANPDLNLYAMAGKRKQLSHNRSISAFLIGRFDNENRFQEGIYNDAITVQGNIGKKYTYEKYIYNVEQVFMGNLKYEFNKTNNIAYNSLFITNNQQTVSDYFGSDVQDVADPSEGQSALRIRQEEKKNTLWVNQVLSNFKVNKIDVELDGSFNTILGLEPDRRENLYQYQQADGLYRTASGTPSYNHRYYGDLTENEIVGRAILGYDFGNVASGVNYGKIKAGYDLRVNHRQYNYQQFNHNFESPKIIDIENPDEVFSKNGLDQNLFRLETMRGWGSDALNPAWYQGDRLNNSVFGNLVYNLNPKWSGDFGLRYDMVYQDVEWDVPGDVKGNHKPSDGLIEKNFLLPSFNLKYALTENNIIRLASSISYTMPQFKEVAPFLYEGGEFKTLGNENLKVCDIYNLDLKWESYFKAGELLSITGFYKYLNSPINMVEINSAANYYSYTNALNATVSGLELELRKRLYSNLSEGKGSTLNWGINASYLYSSQNFDANDGLYSITHISGNSLEGASPFLLNTDLTFKNVGQKFTTTTTLDVNYFSDRIYSLGTAGREDIMERSMPKLDIVFKGEYKEKLGLKLHVKNLLNAEYKLSKDTDIGEVTVKSFKRGTEITLGVNYKF